jgi:hypothetical protein
MTGAALSVGHFVPQRPEAREAMAAMFANVLRREVEPEAIAEITVKVCILLGEYEAYKTLSAEFLGSKIWEKLLRVRDAADGLLCALSPFLKVNPFGPNGSGAFLLGTLALGRDAPSTGTDPLIARLCALRDAADGAAEKLKPYDRPRLSCCRPK